MAKHAPLRLDVVDEGVNHRHVTILLEPFDDVREEPQPRVDGKMLLDVPVKEQARSPGCGMARLLPVTLELEQTADEREPDGVAVLVVASSIQNRLKPQGVLHVKCGTRDEIELDAAEFVERDRRSHFENRALALVTAFILAAHPLDALSPPQVESVGLRRFVAELFVAADCGTAHDRESQHAVAVLKVDHRVETVLKRFDHLGLVAQPAQNDGRNLVGPGRRPSCHEVETESLEGLAEVLLEEFMILFLLEEALEGPCLGHVTKNERVFHLLFESELVEELFGLVFLVFIQGTDYLKGVLASLHQAAKIISVGVAFDLRQALGCLEVCGCVVDLVPEQVRFRTEKMHQTALAAAFKDVQTDPVKVVDVGAVLREAEFHGGGSDPGNDDVKSLKHHVLGVGLLESSDQVAVGLLPLNDLQGFLPVKRPDGAVPGYPTSRHSMSPFLIAVVDSEGRPDRRGGSGIITKHTRCRFLYALIVSILCRLEPLR